MRRTPKKAITQTTESTHFDLCGTHLGVPFEFMTVEQFAEWREDYYLGLLVSPFGRDDDGKDIVPHGMSIHGVPKLHPDDE